MPVIAFFEPRIPQNTGNAIRLAAVTGAELHLIEPLGFDLSEPKLRRAGLDYHDLALVTVHRDLAAAIAAWGDSRILAFTTHTTDRYSDVSYRDDDVLLFGPEPTGLPPEVLAHPRITQQLRIPMLPQRRSLNITSSASIAIYEAWRQLGFPRRKLMTTLLLVRHGQTVWHEGPRYAGSSDIELTDVGRAQAQQLAAWAPTANLDAVVTSQLVRAVETARPAAEACGLELQIDARLAEVAFGVAEGRTRAEMAVDMADALEAHLADPMRQGFPGGESGLEAVERAAAAFRDICAAHPDGRVLVVGHSMTTRLVLCVLLGIDPSTFRTVMPHLDNGTVTTIDLADDGTAALHGYNVPLGVLPS